ncbi:helix-turn-helix domain-containing protein [Streptomyces sp. OE57]|uniref:helix-turn-helix domain-containing protein n=1 Tax=Streptomyces lacaronensis TaxID=3379885 RepID=UPI0039B7852F
MKLFRERAGLTQAELGALVGYSADQVASVECGRRIPKPELVDKADEVLGAGGVLEAMKEELAHREQLAYLEGQGRSALLTDREEVRPIAARYGFIRAQALTPRESSFFIEKLLGEL